MFSLHVALQSGPAIVRSRIDRGPCRCLLIMHRHRRNRFFSAFFSFVSPACVHRLRLLLYRIRHKWCMNGAAIDHLYAYEMSPLPCRMYGLTTASPLAAFSCLLDILLSHDQHFTSRLRRRRHFCSSSQATFRSALFRARFQIFFRPTVDLIRFHAFHLKRRLSFNVSHSSLVIGCGHGARAIGSTTSQWDKRS